MRLPQDAGAEAVVAAGACFGPAELVDDIVTPDDFVDPHLRELYVVGLDLHYHGEPITGPVLRQRCPQVPDETVRKVVSAQTIGSKYQQCARIVAEYGMRRRAIQACVSAAERLQTTTLEADGVLRDLERLLADSGRVLTPVESGPDLDTFLTLKQEYDWIVPDFLERGDRVILTGPEGRGKSTALRQLAVQIAAGLRPFTTLYRNDPARVLLIDLENSAGQVQRAMRPLRAAAEMDPTNLAVIVRNEGIDLNRPSDRRWFEERVSANRPDVLITGPLYKLMDADPTEERPARALSAFLDRMRVRYGFALLLEAHAPHTAEGKEPVLRPYGASLWKRWPEFGIGLRVSNGGAKIIHWRGPRDERADWPTELVRAKGDWPWLAGVDSR